MLIICTTIYLIKKRKKRWSVTVGWFGSQFSVTIFISYISQAVSYCLFSFVQYNINRDDTFFASVVMCNCTVKHKNGKYYLDNTAKYPLIFCGDCSKCEIKFTHFSTNVLMFDLWYISTVIFVYTVYKFILCLIFINGLIICWKILSCKWMIIAAL